ncbi:MAG: Eco57I restriction-modification methylase domain-containing protein, partial [Chloroflexi bacterium]|nr:Eco57I restriction-modification methylase domain-containing protein [Chloroflexota bacterium]
KRLARELDLGQPAAASMMTYWQQLRQLWAVIDQGNLDLDVPAYNGGLFKARSDSFLEKYQVGDLYLRQAIDLLARAADPQTKQRVFVDYRALEIRHLGSIYEGLLEYQGRVADRPLAVRLEKGREIYEPVGTPSPNPSPEAGEGKKLLLLSASERGLEGEVLPGQVYLTTDKGERKVTGSYYTPDYIVKYIVEQTVRPVLEELSVGARQVGAAFSEQGAELSDLPRPYNLETDPAALTQAILGVNVLDPSMGSGHFLVEATDFIARSMVELGLPPPADAAGESDLAYWRRRVAQACIYGVDVNPLAVELAKLSLWLTTVAQGKPLSFLDHHLRCGNSLIGARVADLPLELGNPRPDRFSRSVPVRSSKKRQQAEARAIAAGQLSMLDDSAFAGSLRTATGFMSQIETLRGDTLAEVQEAEQLYRQVVEQITAQARHLADVWTARAFGLEVDDTVWSGLARFVLHGGFALPQYQRILEQAGQLAAQQRFFHWELEFPEVFFDAHGRLDPAAGFDAVVGNPPYVRQEELSPLKPYFAQAYPEVYYGTADLFVYFFGRGLQLLQAQGRLAYISSNSWLRVNYATPLRAYLRTHTTVETLLDLGDNRVFADAPDLYPAIHVVRREPPLENHTAQAAIFTRGEGLAEFDAQVAAKLTPLTIHDQPDSGWQLDDAGRGVFAKDRLVQVDPASAEIIKPLVNGADIRSWFVEDEGRWLILFPDRWTNDTFGLQLNEDEAWNRLNDIYPAIAQHLAAFEKPARVRADKGTYWWELRPCSYYADFEGYKIFWPEMGKSPRFVLAEPGIIGNKTTFMIPGEHPYLLGILMTRVTWFAISRLCVPIGERGGLLRYTLSAQFMSQLPIPDAPTVEREAIGQLAMAITEQARARYQLHRQSRRRVGADLGASRISGATHREGASHLPGLNQKLTAWWELDFPAFRAEIKKVFKQDIPLAERDDWEAWLSQRRSQHRHYTDEIIRLETELNERVYALFDLTPAEVKIIEASTKYRYGEV